MLSCGYNALIDYRYDTTEFVMNTGDLMNKTRLVLTTKEVIELPSFFFFSCSGSASGLCSIFFLLLLLIQGMQMCNMIESHVEFLGKKKEQKEKGADTYGVRPSLKKYSPW